MKNKNIKYSIIAISVLIVVLILLYIFPNKSALNNPESFWKACGDNPVIGDAFHLSKEDNNFRSDTIFAGQTPVGVVIDLENRFWAGDRILTVKSLKTGGVGTYCEK